MTKNNDEILYFIWFSMLMGGRRKAAREIYRRIGSIEKIYRSSRADLEGYGMKDEKTIELLLNKDLSRAERELWFAGNYNVSFLPINSPDYPKRLLELPDAPVLLYVRGTHFRPNDELYIAIIGTRSCSAGGLNMARRLASDLASAGVTVVGGLSDGIEAAAHESCITAGGKTTAALVTGVNKAYSSKVQGLMQRVMNNGAVISPYSFDESGFSGHFHERNHMMAGLCMGVVMVESALKSNSLMTARMAFDLNRDVFAVPGDIHNKNAEGPNELLKTMAKPVTMVKDILEEYENIYPGYIKSVGFSTNSVEFEIPESGNNLTKDELEIIAVVRGFPKAIEEIAARTEKSIAQINGILTMLELKNKIERTPQNTYFLK